MTATRTSASRTSSWRVARLLAIVGVVALCMVSRSAVVGAPQNDGPLGGSHGVPAVAVVDALHTAHTVHGVLAPRLTQRFVHLLLAFAVLAGAVVVVAHRPGRRGAGDGWRAPRRSSVVEPGVSRAPPVVVC